MPSNIYHAKRAERLEAMRRAWEDDGKTSEKIGDEFGVRADSVRRLARKYKWVARNRRVVHVTPDKPVRLPDNPRIVISLPPWERYRDWLPKMKAKYAAIDAHIKAYIHDKYEKDEKESRRTKGPVYKKISEYRRSSAAGKRNT